MAGLLALRAALLFSGATLRGALYPQGGAVLNHYESIFILSPAIDEAESERVSQRMQEVVRSNGGEVAKVEKWGKRKLAYTVRKHKKGEYVLLYFTGGAATVAELERNFKMTDAVIKYMTVRLEKEAIANAARQAQAEAARLAGVQAEAEAKAETAAAPAETGGGEASAEGQAPPAGTE